MSYDHLLKFVLVGDKSVGKTTICNRLVNIYENEASTIGVELKIKNMVVEGKAYKIQLWDTAGLRTELLRQIIRAYYHRAHSIFFVYDITNRKTFERTQRDIEEYQQYFQIGNPVLIIIANKTDLKEIRQVSDVEGSQLAIQYNMLYFEVSYKEPSGINQIITQVVKATHQLQFCLKQQNINFSPPSRRYNCF